LPLIPPFLGDTPKDDVQKRIEMEVLAERTASRGRSAVRIVVLYLVFAAIAAVLNLATQGVLLAIYGGIFRLPAALFLGTGVGLVVKYVLDKYWIFVDRREGVAHHTRTFTLYTVMGLCTTAIFWGNELMFAHLFGESWALVGGAIGLAAGYAVKYGLDREFVFRVAT
jgi:putative flippase GtrA